MDMPVSVIEGECIVTHLSYVLITPARNEEAFIEKTIQSVISQTVLPKWWIIVSDRSTDRTDEIVRRYAATYSFIRLVRIQKTSQRNFGAKVNAFKAGYDSLGNVGYDFIGNLDADVSFVPSYYQDVMTHFADNNRLGIAGGIIQELINDTYVSQNISLNSVAGAVQLFRKECYENIGGYIPLEYGGIDAAAEILARTNGWEVRTLPQYKVLHHRCVTTGKRNIFATRFYQGMTNYLLGYSPFFHIMRSLHRVVQRPLLIGSIASILGYYCAFFQRKDRKLPDSAVTFLRNEQRGRLKSYFVNGGKA